MKIKMRSSFKKAIISLSVLFMMFSCETNNEPTINLDNLLFGNWSNAVYDGEKITFKRVTTLPVESYGVTFKNENIFVERSSGFCGTPPLTFFNTEGNWKMLETTLIEITKQSFPGNFNWRIISLTEQELIVKRELTEQEIDHRNLMNLFDEISNMAYSVSCTNASNWTFIAYGSKACGGPQGYIPYSTQIDTVVFLQKVADYTEAEHQYNIEWGIVSTCDVPNQPSYVECQNGFPVLKY